MPPSIMVKVDTFGDHGRESVVGKVIETARRGASSNTIFTENTGDLYPKKCLYFIFRRVVRKFRLPLTF